LVGRIIAAVQVPIVVWHGVVVLTTIQSSLQDAVAAEISKATGVVGVTSQAQLLEDALDNNIWYVYLAVLVLNLFALVARSLVARPGPKTSSATPIQEDSEDLWETQR
jgi:microsomal dipeptidase-like Zn-dependent dipeptidase